MTAADGQPLRGQGPSADTKCIGGEVLLNGGACMPAPNGQGSICCIAPVTPWVGFINQGEPEQTFVSTPLEGVNANLC